MKKRFIVLKCVTCEDIIFTESSDLKRSCPICQDPMIEIDETDSIKQFINNYNKYEKDTM